LYRRTGVFAVNTAVSFGIRKDEDVDEEFSPNAMGSGSGRVDAGGWSAGAADHDAGNPGGIT
jgi:hypothetical protein